MDLYKILNNSIKKEETKICPACNGKGEINVRYVQEWINTSWVPMEGEYCEKRVSDKCKECDGKGKLTLKWVPIKK